MKALRHLAPFRRKSATEATSAADPTLRATPAADATGEPASPPIVSTASASTDSVFFNPIAATLAADAASDGLSNVASSNVARASGLSPLGGVRSLPRPALRWVGDAGRIALRELDFVADADIVCSWQSETYTLNFADFRFNDSFAAAFRHDLRRAALDPNHALFVLDDGAPIGFLWLVICENTWTGERYGYINNLYLSPSQRAQGLGGELMQQSETWFKSRRIKRVRLTVTIANQAACRLYQSQGYDVTRWEMEKNL